MALDRFDAWWGGLRYVRRSAVLRLPATVLVFSYAIALMLMEHQSKAITQRLVRYLERNTA
ncbi:hypothetical protein BJG93_29625 (plasmid) [Paraburkholderia sprentiae WSM5005]|uniref:Uncharacterized protein n=1 Tax=Paraburkholderia sprentiae WSM5005 TaxID=754502 RepID=A0A1I9YTX0_9BURK|nr:hypothetical protein [Paraburkholderia sprentiae]APA89647.1 hypothetical protein BJG93_29625 [Paraburkholderia sprentiae WSM5005]